MTDTVTQADRLKAAYERGYRDGSNGLPPLSDPWFADGGAAAPMRENDKPPAHWTADDKCDRHPQTVEEWDWRADKPDATEFSIKRLNFAVDRGDPHAPDQMAIVLRVDLSRVLGRLTHYTAHREMLMAKDAAATPMREAASSVGADALAHLESEARRFAGFYKPNSDMANTLNILGNKIAALAAISTAQVDETERVTVPREPTEAMYLAAFNSDLWGGRQPIRRVVDEIWDAMLRAALAPEGDAR